MNKIFRFSFILLGGLLLATPNSLRAQVVVQRLSFSLFSQFQTNAIGTNSNTGNTTEYSRIRDILIGTSDIVKAIAIDLDGPTNRTWFGSELVREINLTNGNEGVFLRKAGQQISVTNFFGISYSNNFTAGITNIFPGATNFGTNVVTVDQFQLHRGWIYNANTTNITTNFDLSAGLHAVAFTSTNMQFSLIAVTGGRYYKVGATTDGVHYTQDVNHESGGAAGTFCLQVNTNFFVRPLPAPAPQFVTGPLRGNLTLGDPIILRNITNGP